MPGLAAPYLRFEHGIGGRQAGEMPNDAADAAGWAFGQGRKVEIGLIGVQLPVVSVRYSVFRVQDSGVGSSKVSCQGSRSLRQKREAPFWRLSALLNYLILRRQVILPSG
jgi:hypothetical protein